MSLSVPPAGVGAVSAASPAPGSLSEAERKQKLAVLGEYKTFLDARLYKGSSPDAGFYLEVAREMGEKDGVNPAVEAGVAASLQKSGLTWDDMKAVSEALERRIKAINDEATRPPAPPAAAAPKGGSSSSSSPAASSPSSSSPRPPPLLLPAPLLLRPPPLPAGRKPLPPCAPPTPARPARTG